MRKQNRWSSILHATTGGDNAVYGDRTPGIWFRPGSTRLHICSAVNGKENYCYDSRPLPMKRYSKVEVIQFQVGKSNKYLFRIRINGKLVKTVRNNMPREFADVTYYASDRWYKPAKAKVKNFILAIGVRRE